MYAIVAFRYARACDGARRRRTPPQLALRRDRVRAYRARETGREAPAALAEGDELARAMEEIRTLRAELAVSAGTERALRQEVRFLRRDLADRDTRFGWLERTAEVQRMARETAERDRDGFARKLAELKVRLRVPVPGTRSVAARSPASPPPSRAERRRQERERRRD